MKENKNKLQIAAFLLNLFFFFFFFCFFAVVSLCHCGSKQTEFADLHRKTHAPRYCINETTGK